MLSSLLSFLLFRVFLYGYDTFSFCWVCVCKCWLILVRSLLEVGLQCISLCFCIFCECFVLVIFWVWYVARPVGQARFRLVWGLVICCVRMLMGGEIFLGCDSRGSIGLGVVYFTFVYVFVFVLILVLRFLLLLS